jgi:NAD(P)-dependent dehydrogenase (short-subunit alcohol dehydrogenase family)
VNVPDLKGQTALVTGANSGLGLEVALQLARANASVVLACRDAIKCEEAARTVRAEV